MRLASFALGGEDAPGQCSIVTLAGAGGGLEANIRRWMGQLGVPVPEEEDFLAFVGEQERFAAGGGDIPGVLVDLTGLSEARGEQADSMLAGVITAGGQTVFIKLTGPVSLLKNEKDRFAALCRSIRFES